MLLTSEKACPYDFLNSLLIFNILNKTSIQFCPYDFPKC